MMTGGAIVTVEVQRELLELEHRLMSRIARVVGHEVKELVCAL
jgi:hypothetical protein